jgi:SAM-dependent methyltransferase
MESNGIIDNSAWRNMAPSVVPGTLAFPSECFPMFAKARRVLELGCGSGTELQALARRTGAECVGVDLNGAAFAQACPGVSLLRHDARLPLPAEGAFDLIIAKAFLTCLATRAEHLAVLKNARALASPCCTLLVMDFLQNWDHPLYRQRYGDGLASGLECGSFAAPASGGCPGYTAHHFAKEELAELVCESGFAIDSLATLLVTTRSGNAIEGFVMIAHAKV